jgi:tetraacyldisaccharide-1-P 4'-kinase
VGDGKRWKRGQVPLDVLWYTITVLLGKGDSLFYYMSVFGSAENVAFKVVVIGNSGTGKTKISTRYAKGEYC